MGDHVDLAQGTDSILQQWASRANDRTSEIEAEREAKRIANEDRERRRRVGDLARQLGPRYTPALVRLDTFEVYYPAPQKPVLKRVRELIPTLPDLVRQGRGLIFIGPCGTGKDRLLAALLYEACEVGFVCSWRNGLDLYGESRDRMTEHQNEGELLRELTKPDVLAISDPLPPAGDPSAWNLQLLLRIIDGRYRAMRPTWVAANIATIEEAEARLTEPVFDRLRDGAEIIKCFWPSYRERAAATRKGA